MGLYNVYGWVSKKSGKNKKISKIVIARSIREAVDKVSKRIPNIEGSYIAARKLHIHILKGFMRL